MTTELGRVVVRGNASDVELAAVLALVSHSADVAETDGYARWREHRLAALRRVNRRLGSGNR